MSPGTLVTVKPEWKYQYRKPGVTMSGVVKALSPNGKIVRVQMDDLGDSYFAVEHVEPASFASTQEALDAVGLRE